MTTVLPASSLLANWVFLATNVLTLAMAAIGQWVYLGNVRREEKREKLKVVAVPALFRKPGVTD